MKLLYAVALVTVVSMLAASCDCQALFLLYAGYEWVICVGNDPVLTDGFSMDYGSSNFTANQWSCPDTNGSPIWQSSGAPVFSTESPFGFAVLGRRRSSKAASPASVGYLPRQLLDLPFPAQPSATDQTSAACNSSQPDVIQVNHDNASVNRISTCPFQFRATIPVATRPLQIAVTPDGLTALVTSFDNAVNFIDLTTNKVTYTLQTGYNINPNGIAISPDGTTAYITSFNSMDPIVAVIDIASRSITATIPGYSYPQSLAISPDGSQLIVTYPFGSQIGIIDTLTNAQSIVLNIQTPRGVAFNSKGTKAYITSAPPGLPGTVQELDTTTFQVDTTYTVGVGPADVAVLYGDRYVVVNNYEGQSVSVVDTVQGSVKTTAVNGSPSGISIVR
jgi:YVTN family beta-propeller protein